MSKKIESAIEAVLTFMEKLPLSASTISNYRHYYKAIIRFCHSRSFDIFSDQEADAFITFHLNRHKKGEIDRTYFATLRRLAGYLASQMTGKTLEWKYVPFRKPLTSCYEKAACDYELHLMQSYAPGYTSRLVSVARQLLFFWRSATCATSKA